MVIIWTDDSSLVFYSRLIILESVAG